MGPKPFYPSALSCRAIDFWTLLAHYLRADTQLDQRCQYESYTQTNARIDPLSSPRWHVGADTPGTPIFAGPATASNGGSGQGSFASFLKGPLPPSGHRIERGTIDLQSDINCLPERSLLGAFGKQHDDYDHDVFNSAGSTLATPHFGPENGVHLKPKGRPCLGIGVRGQHRRSENVWV